MFPPPCPLILTITHYTSSTPDSSPSSNQHLPVETWIEQFGSVVPKLYTIHQIPLFWGGMSNFASIFLVICPVLLMTILPESFTTQLLFKPWVRPNASFILEKSPSFLIPFYLGGGSLLLGISQVALTQISQPKTRSVAIHLPFQQLPPPYCVHLMVWGYAHFHHEKIIQIIITPTFFQILILLLILASIPLILTPMLMIVFNYICRIL